MEEFYFEIGVRIPNSQIKNIISMGSISKEIESVDFKKSFSKPSESQSMSFKVVSNIEIPDFVFLRSMFELCLDVSVDDMSLIHITKDEYIEQIKTKSDSEYSDEIKKCIEKIKYYTKALKGKKIKSFDYKTFKKSGNNFIDQLKIAHKSPSAHL